MKYTAVLTLKQANSNGRLVDVDWGRRPGCAEVLDDFRATNSLLDATLNRDPVYRRFTLIMLRT